MDRWLDDFARAMAAGLSRRAALQRVGSGLLTVLLASADVGETEAKGKKSRCGTGQTQCGSGKKAPCVDLQTDGSNCGGCGVVCPSGQSCQAGHCTAPCPTGQT